MNWITERSPSSYMCLINLNEIDIILISWLERKILEEPMPGGKKGPSGWLTGRRSYAYNNDIRNFQMRIFKNL